MTPISTSMKPLYDIREATEVDLPDVLRIYAQPELDDGLVLSAEAAGEILARMAAYPDYHLFVALAKQKVVGTFALLIMDNIGHLGASSGLMEDVAVDPDWHGQGVGKAMVRHAVDLCREKGCYKLALSANLTRERAHAFYESVGLVRHGYSFRIDLRDGSDSL